MVLSSLVINISAPSDVSEEQVLFNTGVALVDVTSQVLTYSLISSLTELSTLSTSSLLTGGLVGSLVSIGLSALTGNLNGQQVATHLAVHTGVALGTSGLMSLVATYGVASTGTAIGSLSGAAATNATLA